MKDKNGKRIEIEDWVYVDWIFPRTDRPRVGIVSAIVCGIQSLDMISVFFEEYKGYSGSIVFESDSVEKLPNDEKERNELLLLRKFEQ